MNPWLWCIKSCFLTFICIFWCLPFCNGFFDHVLFQLPLGFLWTQRLLFFCHDFWLCSADWNDFRDHVKNILWEEIFNLGVLGVDVGWNWCLYSSSLILLRMVFSYLCCWCSSYKLLLSFVSRKYIGQTTKLAYANKTRKLMNSTETWFNFSLQR